jgi:hypothetical protein
MIAFEKYQRDDGVWMNRIIDNDDRLKREAEIVAIALTANK